MPLQNIKVYFIKNKQYFFSLLLIAAGWLSLNMFYEIGKNCCKIDKIIDIKSEHK